jgi:hypothetical protein
MEKRNNKIGCGIITCDRPEFFEKSLKSLIGLDCVKIVVDDGKEKIKNLNVPVLQTNTPKAGVAKAKNIALKYLMGEGCDHIFLMEDDIEIIDSNVFDAYIKTSISTGIKHFNFALHGNHNLDQTKKPVIRKTINYPDNTKVFLYPNLLGAFSYYHIDVLNDVGFMDESFYNALEHVDHTYQIIKKQYHPPFRWFADIENSDKYLKDIVPDHQQSKIRNENDFMETFKKALDVFIKKNNFSVVQGYGPNEKFYSEEECVKNLKEIWKNNQQKK